MSDMEEVEQEEQEKGMPWQGLLTVVIAVIIILIVAGLIMYGQKIEVPAVSVIVNYLNKILGMK